MPKTTLSNSFWFRYFCIIIVVYLSEDCLISGIISKLNYIKDDVGANAVWINPVYKSSGYDMGYDIADFKAIDELFGTMDDFTNLRSEMADKGKCSNDCRCHRVVSQAYLITLS